MSMNMTGAKTEGKKMYLVSFLTSLFHLCVPQDILFQEYTHTSIGGK